MHTETVTLTLIYSITSVSKRYNCQMLSKHTHTRTYCLIYQEQKWIWSHTKYTQYQFSFLVTHAKNLFKSWIWHIRWNLKWLSQQPWHCLTQSGSISLHTQRVSTDLVHSVHHSFGQYHMMRTIKEKEQGIRNWLNTLWMHMQTLRQKLTDTDVQLAQKEQAICQAIIDELK